MLTDKSNFLKYIPKNIKLNSEIITPDTINQNYLLHLSNIQHPNNVLIPNVSRRAAKLEDNTLARVHTAPNILGCLHGVSTTHLNVIDNYVDIKTKKLNFKNGYYIYKIPFEYAIRPNKQLVFDVDKSNEMWLIRYENIEDYKAELVGYLIIDNISVIPTNNRPIFNIKFLINTNSNIKIDNDKEISIGNKEFDFIVDHTTNIEVKDIEQTYFDNKRQLNASMLSIDNIPFFKGI